MYKYRAAQPFFLGYPLRVKLTRVVIFMVMSMPPCFYFIVHIAQHHCDVIIMFWAVLAITNLCAESHLVMSLVNFQL